jgi:hypothetical protein
MSEQKMTPEKLASTFSTIHRALGMIEGVSFALDKDFPAAASILATAVEMLDNSMEVILNDN